MGKLLLRKINSPYPCSRSRIKDASGFVDRSIVEVASCNKVENVVVL
jgi:hypothetical protein